MNRLAYLCVKHDLILKITYSTYIGWTIKVHRRGYSTPIVHVINDDKDIAFDLAYEEVKVNEYNEQ